MNLKERSSEQYVHNIVWGGCWQVKQKKCFSPLIVQARLCVYVESSVLRFPLTPVHWSCLFAVRQPVHIDRYRATSWSQKSNTINHLSPCQRLRNGTKRKGIPNGKIHEMYLLYYSVAADTGSTEVQTLVAYRLTTRGWWQQWHFPHFQLELAFNGWTEKPYAVSWRVDNVFNQINFMIYLSMWNLLHL